jgi:YidC/Oxa1 family membrane protein insertase
MDRNQIVLLSLALGVFLVALRLGGGGFGSSAPVVPPPAAVTAQGSANAPGGAERAPGQPSQAPDATAESRPEQAEPARTETISNDDLQVEISNRGARITSVRLTEYSDQVGAGGKPVELATSPQGLLAVELGDAFPGIEEARYRMGSSEGRSLEQVLEWRGGAEVIQRVELDEHGYGGWLSVMVRNRGTATLRPVFDVGLFGSDPPQWDSREPLQNYRMTVFERDGESLHHDVVAGLEKPGFFGGGGAVRTAIAAPAEWAALESQYFLAAVLTEGSGHGGLVTSQGLGQGRVSLTYPSGEIGPGQQVERRYRLYLGPKVDDLVEAVDARLEPALVVGYAWVRPVTKLFARLLNWLHANTVPNYGFGIILITVLLRLLMYPLTQKSMQSMRRMTAIAPQLKEIQERYRDDAQRQQQELMALYKRTGIHPLSAVGGGCLPMLLQMPFMVALYFALQGMIELRHAPFVLWIDDLSVPENIKLLGVPIRPLTLAMGGSMFLQTYLQPGNTNDPQAQQQRQMMLLMSGVFVVMFYSFPSGLVLYWLVSNLLGITQQMLVNRWNPSPAAPRQGEVKA